MEQNAGISDSDESPEPNAVVDPPIVVQGTYYPRETYRQHFGRRKGETLGRGQRFSHWMDETLGEENYGAPRVFDLFTLLAITLAFALLFTFLRLIEPLLFDSLPEVTIAISVFASLTAIAQLAIWGGNRPRISSIIAGPGIWLLITLGFLTQNPRLLLSPVYCLGFFFLSIFGIPAGYLGGAMVAGVFLIADVSRRRILIRNPLSEAPKDDDIWGQ